MTALYKLTGTLQQYAWGGESYIPHLIGFTAQQNQPYAEWWLGAHSSSPSMIEIEAREIPLNQFLKQNPTVLGEQSRAMFGDELPYLLKILDVKQPLSIQLHPTKQQAEIGFAAENARGVDLKDPTRTYKDNNHKPEMMIALSDFWLLHGFKPKTAILHTLRERQSLSALADQLEKQDLHSFYATIMQADQTQLANWLLPILTQNQLTNLTPENPDYWVLYSQQEMAISLDKLDAGLMCFYLFNIVQVKQGEGIFQDAGIPHAYLRGQNIELMACSDNVIRGGLTPKHVDIEELLKVIDCREVMPELIPAAPQVNGLFTYTTPAKDFALANIRYDNTSKINGTAKNAIILLVMQGRLKISEKTTALELKQGESAFICADTDYQIDGVENGYAVLAKLP
ncbi:mannose-6-phosphate isomerase, class I [Lonepinella sp. MS14435]|uniref:mannose-6-phosphate isomerase, class I n=1 Tax=Lonepinella sp. MS14435 TaxID=3003618 RepID=UPI0036D75FCB